MAKQIYPCLWFDGQAKAAAEFYCSIFPNSKILNESHIVVNWELNGKKIMGLNGGPMYKINPSISLFASCSSVNETEDIWNKLIKGGKVLMPLDKYDWNEKYGWLEDKFGMTWQIMVGRKEDPGSSISPSMLFVAKQFGKAEAALKFYTSLFENSSVDIISKYPEGSPFSGKVLFSEFKLNGYNLIAMDGPGDHNYSFNEGVSFFLNCETQEEIDFYWNKFTTDGGAESMCGWCKDKFGVSWQVIPAILGELMSNPDKGKRVVQAFLKMKKFDIEKLKNA